MAADEHLGGLARKARVAGRTSGSCHDDLELRLIKVRIATDVGRRSGKTDPLPNAWVAEVKRAHIGPQLAKKDGD